MSALLGDQRLASPPVERKISRPKPKPDRPNSTLTNLQIVKKYLVRLYKTLRLKYFIPLLVVLIYGFIGAGLFMLAERPENVNYLRAERLRKINESRSDMAAAAISLFYNTSIKQTEKLLLITDLFKEHEKEIDFTVKSDPAWGFWESTYYAVTIYTTIGYGNICAATAAGQVLTVFYALLGIPLVLTALNELGKFLFLLILDVYNCCVKKTSCKKGPIAPVKVETSKMETDGGTVEISTHKFIRDETIDIGELDISPLEEEMLEKKVMSIPVWVALLVTISWILICAAMFFAIEYPNWTFWQSIYFIFISFSTIGLGDFTPERPEYMVGLLFFVIVGLSLVSMSIGVVQNRLEELYIQLLMRILTEYQKRLALGLDETDASVGMMEVWGGSKTAKFLLPLLSKSKMQNAVQKFTEEAESKGLSIPQVLRKMDPDAGIPKLFTLAKTQQTPEQIKEVVAETIQTTNVPLRETQIPTKSRPVDNDNLRNLHQSYEAESQTDVIFCLNTPCQTDFALTEENSVQTICSCFGLKSETSQTHIVMTWNNDAQTNIVHFTEESSQTATEVLSDSEVQTVDAKMTDETTQSAIEVSDFTQQAEVEKSNLSQMSMQTSMVGSNPMAMQTSMHETMPNSMQTSFNDLMPKSMQTSMSESLPKSLQTSMVETLPNSMQTSMEQKPTAFERFMQTSTNETLPRSMQTSIAENLPKSLQTSMVETLPNSMQTSMEQKPMAFESYMQTSMNETLPRSMQTSTTENVPKSLQTSINEETLQPQGDLQESVVSSISGEEFSVESVGKAEVSEENESESDLEWDPIDGMHAEKQQKVDSLKKMFDTNKVVPKPEEKRRKPVRKAQSVAK